MNIFGRIENASQEDIDAWNKWADKKASHNHEGVVNLMDKMEEEGFDTARYIAELCMRAYKAEQQRDIFQKALEVAIQDSDKERQ